MSNKKHLISIFFLFCLNNLFSQNRQILYGFAENPQTLLLNPGAETNFKYHIGVPLLSGFSGNIGSTNVVIADLFLKDNIDFTTKFNAVLSKLETTDHINFNLQVDVLSGGYRYDDKTYFSFGFYEEFDFIGYFPKDVATLLNEGNAAYLNRSFSLSQLLLKTDLIGVLHAGITRKRTERLTVGARVKIYSSSLSIKSSNNSGSFTTVLGSENIYRHHLENINVSIQTSGILDNNVAINDYSSIYKDTFLGGNLGLGFDMGFTYHSTPQLEFSASIIDVGFIKHKKKNTTYTAKGTYSFDGINFGYDPANPRDYWQELETDFKTKISTDNNNDSYISWRPAKVNASVKYKYGEVRLNTACYDTSKMYYSNAIGLQLFTVFRPLKPEFALTAFYEKAFTENLLTKVTYTIDQFSATNVGLGLSTKLGNVSIFGMIDNVFKLEEFTTANNVSVQFGINLIYN